MSSAHIAPAVPADADQLAEVAAATFPLACPPDSDPADIADFVASTLSAARFAEYLTDPQRVVLAARVDGHIVGYAILIDGVPEDPDVQRAVTTRPAIELSKIYVQAHQHGTGVASALMAAALATARGRGALCLWLGVNEHNLRAQTFYRRQGFTVAGQKTFRLGRRIEHDLVLTQPL